MADGIFDLLWHRTLKRPYRLKTRVDVGSGPLVVLLHGIGRTGLVWKYLIEELGALPVRVVALDLMGFGESPKPEWLDYAVDDHVNAVIHSIEKLRPEQPVILVGHSMGCLIAVRLAAKRPDLVRHLVLFEMPLYRGLPNKRLYRLRLNFYTKLYNWIIEYHPTFDAKSAKLSERLAHKFFGLEVDSSNWQSFVKSMTNTIFEQTAPEDIPKLLMPMDVIYGSYDMLVIGGTVQYAIGEDKDNAVIHTVRAGHRISRKASKFLKSRIEAALESSLETLEESTTPVKKSVT